MIREASLANSISGEEVGGWVGRPWIDTVDDGCGVTIERMIAEARTNGVSDFRRVEQRFPSGVELPIEYNAVRLGNRSGMIVIGKNLQTVTGVQTRLREAQHAREQEAWKLRGVENRSRLPVETSEDPVLLLRGDDLRILEANPSAIRAGAFDAGPDFPAVLSLRDRAAFVVMMARIGEDGRTPGIMIHLGAAGTSWLARASLTAGQPEPVFMIQLTPVAPAQDPQAGPVSLDGLIDRLPDGFVLVDAAGLVRRANRAFLDLVQAAVPAAVIGQPLSRWLSQPGADAAALIATIERHRLVRRFSTTPESRGSVTARCRWAPPAAAHPSPH